MAEDMTYEPVTDVTALHKRVQELEAQLNAAIVGGAQLERQQARAVKLLDSCLDFLDTLDTDNWPPALDFAIRQYKGMLKGEPEETPEQMLTRFLNTTREVQP